jgi:hypothetical protein
MSTTTRASVFALGLLAAFAACATAPAPIVLTDEVPAAAPAGYDAVVAGWTRHGAFEDDYQQALAVDATFKAPAWRVALGERDATLRGLTGAARAARLTQAEADARGPYELELLVTTWDRRENELQRGKKSVWRVVLVDEQDHEIEPLEIVRDKRPPKVIRAEFPTFGDFAVAYVARFPRTTPLLGPTVRRLRLRMTSARGGVELAWTAR